MKNINKLKNGKWQFSMIINGKRHRKNFSTKTDAITYASNFNNAKKFELSFFQQLSGDQIKDIKDALAILPKDKTLTYAVQKICSIKKDNALSDLADSFIQIKNAKHDMGGLSDKEHSVLVGKINHFKNTFNNFSDATADALLQYLKNKGKNKTVSNWRIAINEFLNYCVSKEAITENPLKFIKLDEFLKAEIPHEIGILSVDDTKQFFEILQRKFPNSVKFYALALFAGVRIAELPRMKEEYFLYDKRKIVFPAQIGKVKKSWVLEDLPENLWVWLDKHKGQPIQPLSKYNRTHGFEDLNLPHNFARHCFATYHLSLYFDFSKTARITRNSEQVLKDNYLSKLVDKETAKKYFEIIP